MMSLVISACLISDPAVCKEHQVPVRRGGSTRYCTMYAAPWAAKWAVEHPDWKIKRWRCAAYIPEDDES